MANNSLEGLRDSYTDFLRDDVSKHNSSMNLGKRYEANRHEFIAWMQCNSTPKSLLFTMDSFRAFSNTFFNHAISNQYLPKI